MKNVTDYLHKNNFQMRKNAGNGLWMSALLPICLVTYYLTHKTSFVYFSTTILSLSLLEEFAIFLFVNTNPSYKGFSEFVSLFSTVPLFCLIFIERAIVVLIISVICVINFKTVLTSLLRRCPQCFTLGEAAVAVQAVILFIFSSILSIMDIWSNGPITNIEIIQVIIQVGLLTVLVIVTTVAFAHKSINIYNFTLVAGSYIGLMLAVLHLLLGRSPVLFIFNFIIEDQKRVYMILYWLCAICLSVLFVNFQITAQEKASTAKRKVFHLLAAAVYLPGLMYTYDLLYLASGISLAVIIALETIRKMNFGIVSKILNDGFSVFADEKDAGGLSTTVLYLSLGLNSGMALNSIINRSEFSINSISGIISVGIGDTAASYFGSKFGKTKIKGTNKSVEGTVASLVTQILTIQVLVWLGYTRWHLWTIVAIAANCMTEALSDQVDNLMLPLITYAILTLVK